MRGSPPCLGIQLFGWRMGEMQLAVVGKNKKYLWVGMILGS